MKFLRFDFSCLLFLLIFSLISSTSIAQTPIENRLGSEICNCLSNERGIKEFTTETYLKCFEIAARNNNKLLQNTAFEKYGDSSYASGNKLGKLLFNDISVLLVNQCDKYYTLRKAKRLSDLNKITTLNRDSLHNIIDSLNKVSEIFQDYFFFQKRASTLFRLKNFKQSISDFDKAIILNSSDISSLAMGAWACEITGQLDKAIDLYKKLTNINSTNIFLVYLTMAQRSKSGR